MTFHIEVRNSPPLEIPLIARQGVLKELKPSSSIHILAAQFQVNIGVGQRPIAIMLGTNLFIVLWNEDIALNATAEGHLSLCRRCRKQHRRHQQQDKAIDSAHAWTRLLGQEIANLLYELILGTIGISTVLRDDIPLAINDNDIGDHLPA